MSFAQWLQEVARELGQRFGDLNEGIDYIRNTGAEPWREMYEDGMSPDSAAEEEAMASG